MYYTEHVPLSVKIKVKEEKVLNVIEIFINKYGFSPSVREIGKLSGIPSTSTTLEYLKRLKAIGAISWDPKSPRTIRVIKNDL